MSLPPHHAIEITGGDTLNFVFRVNDLDLDAPENPPVPRDLTGWSAESQVRTAPSSPDVLCEWAIETLDDTGYVRMKLTGTQTRLFIAPRTVVSDVELFDPLGDNATILVLDITATQDITREEPGP